MAIRLDSILILIFLQNHNYSQIMKEYHKTKKENQEVPKVLGLTASIIVKSVKGEEEFRSYRSKLEALLDAKGSCNNHFSNSYLVIREGFKKEKKIWNFPDLV